MSKTYFSVCLLVFSLTAIACCRPAEGTRPTGPARVRPFPLFSEDSPWRHRIGSGALHVAVPQLESVTLCINYDDRWTSALYAATPSDRTGTLYFSMDTWSMLHRGMPNAGNPPDVENSLRMRASPEPLYPANPYSTVVAGSADPVWPMDYHRAIDPYYSRTFSIPGGARPSPDSDGYISVLQPNGWVLDAYAAVVLANGDIVCMMASYVDSAGKGTGWSNGRRASMLPSFAGLIRPGELSSGAIPHVLAGMASPTLLREEARWPAWAFDMRAGYSGSLPMGALLAIPGTVDIGQLPLTAQGKVLARCLQDFGMYIVDRCGNGGLIVLADLNAPDIRWKGSDQDLQIIKRYLHWVSNNSESSP
jgi:hypothetical protein